MEHLIQLGAIHELTVQDHGIDVLRVVDVNKRIGIQEHKISAISGCDSAPFP